METPSPPPKQPSSSEVKSGVQELQDRLQKSHHLFSTPLAILTLFQLSSLLGEVILIHFTYRVGYHDHPAFLKIPVKHKNLQVESSNYSV